MCGSSKPTPTSLNGKATKPARRVKKMKGRPSLKGQEQIANENHRRVTRDGRGRGRCMEKWKVNIINEKKTLTRKMSRTTENHRVRRLSEPNFLTSVLQKWALRSYWALSYWRAYYYYYGGSIRTVLFYYQYRYLFQLRTVLVVVIYMCTLNWMWCCCNVVESSTNKNNAVVCM